MGGQVDTDVVPAREERRHHRDRPVGGQCAHDLFRGRPHDVDERDVHRSVELLGDPFGQLADHRDALRLPRAVGDQQVAHNACISGSSTGSR